jgi:hypothetical protein
LIRANFDLDEPDSEDETCGFSIGYYHSIYFPKVKFSDWEFRAAISHEMQHIANYDFSRKLALDSCICVQSEDIRNKLIKKEYDRFVLLTEIRSDIMGCLKKDIKCVNGAISGFEKELKNLLSKFTSGGDEHPSHKDRIQYLSMLKKQLEIICKSLMS